MKGLAEIAADNILAGHDVENEQLIAKANREQEAAERRVWMKGWETGLAHGADRGRAAYRVKLRKIFRERGATALIAEVTSRPRKSRRG